MQGPHLKLNLDTNIGDMTKPVFQMPSQIARSAISYIWKAVRNTRPECGIYHLPIGNNDWMLKASQLEIDNDRRWGARNARVEFLVCLFCIRRG